MRMSSMWIKPMYPGWFVCSNGQDIIIPMKRSNSIFTGLFNGLLLIGLVMLSLGPRYLAGWMDLRHAEEAIEESRYAEASLFYASAALRLPASDELWEKAGMAALAAGDTESARSQLERARSLTPQGRLTLGEVYFALGDAEGALKIWKAMQGEPVILPDLLDHLARFYEQQGDYETAIRYFYELRDLDPSDVEAQYRLGALLAAFSPREATSELGAMVSRYAAPDARLQFLNESLSTAMQVDDPAYQFVSVGRALAVLEEWPLAAEAFRSALADDPDYAEAWAWLGEAYQHTGLDGLNQLERAVRLRPDSATCRAFYALYWLRKNRPAVALESLLTAEDLEPGNAAWQVMIGDTYVHLGDLVQALAHYKQAVSVAPDEAGYWHALADFCLRYNVEISQTGLSAASRLLVLEPEDWQSLDTMGQMMLALDRFFEAENYLQRAAESAPEEADVHMHLAWLFLQTGDRTSAYDQLVRVRGLDPGGELGLQAERLLEHYFP